jgi:hypothetical protein
VSVPDDESRPPGGASPDPADGIAADPVAADPVAADPFAAEREQPLSIGAQLRDAARRSGLGQVAPGEAPSGAALLTAIGGVRGLCESILPGFAFLIVFAITHAVVPSVLIPVGIAVIFVIVRLVQRQSLASSLVGIVGVVISAGLSLITGRAESNFVPGIIINAVCCAVLLASLVARRPLIGLIVGLLLPAVDPDDRSGGADWRSDPGKRRVTTIATWLWVGLFALRLAIEIPLYLTAQVELLAGIKLITGVPLYAGLLWVTWLLCRSVFHAVEEPDEV